MCSVRPPYIKTGDKEGQSYRRLHRSLPSNIDTRFTYHLRLYAIITVKISTLYFVGLLLSRHGIVVAGTSTFVVVCNECRLSLKKNNTFPPKYAIANGFYIGCLPKHLCAATWVETIMTQLVTVVAQTRVMRGGKLRAIAWFLIPLLDLASAPH
jgi:hypothetical protein